MLVLVVLVLVVIMVLIVLVVAAVVNSDGEDGGTGRNCGKVVVAVRVLVAVVKKNCHLHSALQDRWDFHQAEICRNESSKLRKQLS